MKGKGGLALLLGIGKPKKEPSGMDEGVSESGDELADILGVPDEKREAFKSAMHAYVKQCAGGADEPDADDEGDEHGEY